METQSKLKPMEDAGLRQVRGGLIGGGVPWVCYLIPPFVLGGLLADVYLMGHHNSYKGACNKK